MQAISRLTTAAAFAAATSLAFATAPVAQDVAMESDPSLVLGYSMERAIGAPVRTGQGEEVGEISDVVLTVDGKADRAILSVGGYLGVGDKLVVIPYDSLTFAADHAVLTDITQQELKAKAAFAYPESDEILIAKVPGAAAATGEEAAIVEEMENYARQAATEMQQLQNQVESYAKDVEQGTVETSQQAQKAIEENWNAVENQWQRLSNATAESWTEVRQGFERAQSDFEKQWQDQGPEGAGKQGSN